MRAGGRWWRASRRNLTFEQAAAVPLAGNTALMGLRDAGRVSPGQRVLINGASGGVGTFAVQIAKALGAEVTAVCSTRNVDLVRSLGADHVIDYTREDFTLRGRRYDVVFDLVGNRSLGRPPARARRRPGRSCCPAAACPSGGSLVGPMGLVIKAQLVSRFVRQRLVAAHRVARARRTWPRCASSSSRDGHAGHRPDLPAERDRRGDPVRRGRARPGQGRHHGLTHAAWLRRPRRARR